MILRIEHLRRLGVCIVKMSFTYAKADTTRLSEYGYPTINIGGTFSNQEITFTLPNSNKKFSEFPIEVSFDGITLGHDLARKQALLYSSTMETRLTNVWNEFKAIPDDFKDDKVKTL